MTRRRSARLVLLWCAFVAVHVVVAAAGWAYPSQPMGDVVLVYEPWATAALTGGPVVGITEVWVYPQLALAPMILAKLLSLPLIAGLGVSGAYLVAWAVLVAVLDAVAYGILLGRAPTPHRRTAAWFWVAALALLGPVGIYRIDAITVPIAVIAGLWLVRRPALGAALLAIGAWIKIWPGALLLAAVVASRHRMRLLLSGGGVAVGVLLLLALLGADSRLFGFLSEQTGRGLQVEAVAATPFVWLASAGLARIDYSFEILTFQITAAGADAVAGLLTPLMVVLVIGLTLLGARAASRGAAFSRLFPPLALALVTTLIVANKVGSPQFQTWLIAPVLLWLVLDRDRATGPAVVVLLLSGLTCLVYPLFYDALLRAEALPAGILTLRNVLLVVLLVLSTRALLRVPIPRSTSKPRE